MSENKTKSPATRQKESGWGSDNEHESEMMASAMPPLFGLAASPAQPNPGDVKSFPDDENADDRGIKIPGIPPSIVAKIIDEEGLEFESYEDNVGILTAGIGHKLVGDEKTKFPKGTKVSQAQIVKWAQKDMDGAWKATESQYRKLGVSQIAFREALFSVNYQLGVNWHTIHVKTWGYMLKGEWEKAALEAADSTWNIQTPKRVTAFQAALRGLIGTPTKKASKEGKENPKESMTEAFHRRVKEADEVRKNSANKPLDVSSKGNETSPKSNAPKSAAKAEPKGASRVKIVQTKLKELGLYTGTIDGIEFRRDKKESNTTKGIKAFQKSKGLPITGKADAETWDALNGKEAKSSGFAEPFRKKVAEAKEAAKAQESKGWGNDLKPDSIKSEENEGRVGNKIGPKVGSGKKDQISKWILKTPDESSIMSKNQTSASLILEASDLGLVAFSTEGFENTKSGLSGTRDTFVKIQKGELIGNGKSNGKGDSYFDPKKNDVPILLTIISILKGVVSNWDQSGRKGEPSKLKLGSFMVWNSGSNAGTLRSTNHGAKAKAIDFNGVGSNENSNMNFGTPEAVEMVYSAFSSLPKGVYEIGLPFQGEFFAKADFGGKMHTAKASDGSWAYTKIINSKIRKKVESMIASGYELKVITDHNNHLHLAIGGGGSSYAKGSSK